MKFDVYDPQNGPFYDETFAAPGVPRPGFEPLVNGINGLESGSLLMRQAAAERALLSMGITFTLYGDGGSAERIFPRLGERGTAQEIIELLAKTR